MNINFRKTLKISMLYEQGGSRWVDKEGEKGSRWVNRGEKGGNGAAALWSG